MGMWRQVCGHGHRWTERVTELDEATILAGWHSHVDELAKRHEMAGRGERHDGMNASFTSGDACLCVCAHTFSAPLL